MAENPNSQKLPTGEWSPPFTNNEWGSTPNEIPPQSNQASINGDQENLNELISTNYNGSLAYMLSQNTGRRIIVDFLVGTSNLIRKEGILYLVGLSFIVLYDEKTNIYTVCNLYSIEFVSFLPNNPTSTQVLKATTIKRV